MPGEPYFIWGSVDSRNLGIWVNKYPDIVRPPLRYQEIIIPGRPGRLTMLEGTDVYDRYIREIQIMPKPGANIHQIMSTYVGRSRVIFGCEPDRAQYARIYDEAAFQKQFEEQRSAVLRFLCEPFKRPVNGDETINIDLSNPSFTLQGTGDVIAYPKIEFTGSGTVSIFMNSNEMAFSNLDNQHVVIDCEAREAYKTVQYYSSEQKVPVAMYGDFITLYHTGSMLIRWSGNISSLSITPRWRWF